MYRDFCTEVLFSSDDVNIKTVNVHQPQIQIPSQNIKNPQCTHMYTDHLSFDRNIYITLT
jgi:hypothetical protein